MDLNFWIFRIIHFIILFVFVFSVGKLVEKFSIKVNYSRKIVHFFVIFFPFFLKEFIHYDRTSNTVVITALSAIIYFVIFIKPIRSRSKIVATMFKAIDRPEDRPYTLIWFVTQYIAGTLVLIPLYIYMAKSSLEFLIFIPIIINGIGDGLAEPIGIRFGKHSYQTRALFTSKRYIRTLEGSACLFVVSLIALFLYHDYFTMAQLIIACLTVPIIATITEAYAPHTWDSPLIFLSTGLSLVVIINTI